jgi:hypothetical protein
VKRAGSGVAPGQRLAQRDQHRIEELCSRLSLASGQLGSVLRAHRYWLRGYEAGFRDAQEQAAPEAINERASLNFTAETTVACYYYVRTGRSKPLA